MRPLSGFAPSPFALPGDTTLVDQHALRDTLADYAATIARGYDIGQVLYRLSDQVMRVLEVDGAGVSIADGDTLRFVSATDDSVVRIEETQIEARQGPCQDAFAAGEVVFSSDLRQEDRWPVYRPVALENGCVAVAGVPLLTADVRIGALNVYSRSVTSWNDGSLDVARILADMAAGYVTNAATLARSEQLTRNLQHALDSRVVIEQAKGILAERHNEPTAQAFERLRTAARDSRRPIHDVAGDVVDGRPLP